MARRCCQSPSFSVCGTCASRRCPPIAAPFLFPAPPGVPLGSPLSSAISPINEATSTRSLTWFLRLRHRYSDWPENYRLNHQIRRISSRPYTGTITISSFGTLSSIGMPTSRCWFISKCGGSACPTLAPVGQAPANRRLQRSRCLGFVDAVRLAGACQTVARK